jgi:hypothetical protein
MRYGHRDFGAALVQQGFDQAGFARAGRRRDGKKAGSTHEGFQLFLTCEWSSNLL